MATQLMAKNTDSRLAQIWFNSFLMLAIPIYLLVLPAENARAHEVRPTVADIAFDKNQIEMKLLVNLEAILSEIGTEHDDTDDSPAAEQYNQYRSLPSDELNKLFLKYAPSFYDQIELQTSNSYSIELGTTALQIPPVGDTRSARDSTLFITGTLLEQTDSVSFSWNSVYGDIILRSALADGDNAFSFYVLAGATSDKIPTNAAAQLTRQKSLFQTSIQYIKIGFVHIIPRGADHILFVIGLFLLTTAWRPILLQVTAFTLAHTMTLGMGVLGLVQVPASIVEPLIALSIAVVCLENLFTRNLHHWRLVMVIGFGLLHGLGFAGVLQEIGLDPSAFLPSLFAFNIGVELGQLAVIALCLVFIGWPLGKKSWYHNRVVKPASLCIAIIGITWFVQRIAW